MNKKGFTLIELLTVVLIIGVLTSIALPQYTRSIERSRATEAMTNVKAFNDAVYMYAASRPDSACPTSFAKLAMSVSGTSDTTTLSTKAFKYELNKANQMIPGTECKGVTATRINAKKYKYIIWNPFVTSGSTGKGAVLACYGADTTNKELCQSLNMDKDQFGNTFSKPY